MNAFALELAPERLAKASQTCFHRGIRCIEGCADQGNAGGDIHHHGISAGPQSGERRAGQQDWREQVDDHHLLDIGFRGVLQPASPHAAGVVDEDVESAQRLYRLVQRGRASLGTSHVSADARRRVKAAQCIVQDASAPSGDDHPGASRDQRMGQREADPARSARDEDPLVLQFHFKLLAPMQGDSSTGRAHAWSPRR